MILFHAGVAFCFVKHAVGAEKARSPNVIIILTDGHSIVPLVEDEHAESSYDEMHWQWKEGWMVRQGDWKLIMNDTNYMVVLSSNPCTWRTCKTNNRSERIIVASSQTLLHD